MAEATSENRGAIVATITTNAEGWFQAVSPQFLALIGRPVEALAGVNLVDLVHPLQSAVVRGLLGAPTDDEVATRLFGSDDQWIPVILAVEGVSGGRLTLSLRSESEPIAPVDGAPESSQAAVAPPVAASQDLAPAPEPTVPADVNPEFPYEDSEAHMAYVALIPADNIPKLRDAVRNSIGDASTPMLEIDADGRTVFVRGAWSELSTEGGSGADVFEELVAKSGRADEILGGLAAVVETGQVRDIEIAVAGIPPRWVRLMAIPSPHLTGVIHGLVVVVAESQLRTATTVPVAPVVPGTVADSARTESRQGTSRKPDYPPAPSDGGPSVHTDGAAAVTPAVPPPEPSATARQQSDFSRTWGVRPSVRAEGARPQRDVELTSSPGTTTRALWGGAGVLTYLAMQGLYLGPTYGWSSPVQGLLNSQECMIQPLCDNEVLRHNHLAVFALIGAVAAFTFLFRRVGPRQLITDRPTGDTAASPIPGVRLRVDKRSFFSWLAVFAFLVVTVQTLFTDSVSVPIWIAASCFGAVAAWRADRDARIPLGSTMAALALGLSCLFVPLGIGSIWLGEHRVIGVILVAFGAAFFGYALLLNRSSESSFDPFDLGAMLGLSTVALVLGLLRHRTWRYAFIGDEWSFFEGALDGRRGNARLDTFDIGGPNDYFTGLTFELQGAVMRVAGDNVWGWRLSALLPMVLSVAAMYAFTRWLSGRTAALVAASALGAGHMLLSFSMIGYNNSQSLVAVSASFAALAWAHQRPSALRFFLLGSAVGSTFLVYAMARLALLPIGLLFLVLFRRDLASFTRRLGWSALGGLAMAAPALFSWQNWEALLKATPAQAEDRVLASGSVTRQVFENTIGGWLSFIGSTTNTHFIVGPHLDVFSALLLIIGLGYVLARSGTDMVLRWFLIGGVGLWTAINAIQQYDQISNTRSFMIPLVYCVFVGIGAAAVLPMIAARAPSNLSKRAVVFSGAALLGILLVVVNQWHIGSYANDRQQLTEQAVLVQQFELTGRSNGQGMPIYVGWPEERNARLNMVLRAHEIAAERIVVVPTNGAINIEQLCGRDAPVMVAIHQRHPQAIAWTDQLASCWGTTPTTMTDPFGAPKLRSVTNAAGSAELVAEPTQRFSFAASTADFSLADTIDIATDGSGAAYALTRSDDGAAIHQLETGKSFDLAQNQPVDFAITNDGLFVVAGNGGDDRVVWYDGQGGVIRRYAGREELPVIGGLAVVGDGLWVSDTFGSRVLRLDAKFKIEEVRSGQGAVIEPSAIAVGPDDGVWVFSARAGQIVLIDAQDQPVTRIDAATFAATDAPRLSSTADGFLIRPIPDRPVIELVDPTGQVLDSRGGMNRPVAAATRDGELIAADPRWEEVPVLAVDTRWVSVPTGTVAWGERAVSSDPEPLSSPFFNDEVLEPGPILTELEPTEMVQINDMQTWRSLGGAVLGEVHAVAAVADGGFAADVNGRVVRLDQEAAALGVSSVSGGGSTFISDMAPDNVGGVWVLDAGLGRVSRVDFEGNVTLIETDTNPLRNARGVGAGRGDSVWVASTAGAQLTQLDGDGAVMTVVSLPGRQPSDVAQADDGSLWIIDAEDIELVHLTESGEVISVLPIDSFGSVESPHLVVIDDVVWVTEPDLSAAFAVDATTGQPNGERVVIARPDDTRVDKAIGIGAGPDGRLWVVDSRAGAVIIIDN